MLAKEKLIQEIDQLPDSLVEEAIDFIQNLKVKHVQQPQKASLQESADLYAETYETDTETQELTKLAQIGWLK